MAAETVTVGQAILMGEGTTLMTDGCPQGARSTGGEDRTWGSVLRALEKSRKGELAEQLRTEWFAVYI